MTRILKQAPDGISFLELLLDETLCAGTIKVEKSLVQKAGGINFRLKSGQKYELFLRIANDMPVLFTDEPETSDDAYLTFTDDFCSEPDFRWQTDCYITGKYSRKLQESGLFNTVLQSLLSEAQTAGRESETLTFLQQMIGRTDAYFHIDEGSLPILIYKGDDICHNVLNVFAEQFGNALSHAGKKVLYFDCKREDINSLTQYMYQHFQAIIGVQSYLFSIKMKDEVHYLHEYIYGPKYNFIFDHPIWMQQHLLHRYPDFYVLTHDEYYVAFTEKFFNRKAFLFPPAGMIDSSAKPERRIYDISFVGTYGNYLHEVMLIHKMERKRRFLANRFLLKMRQNPDLTSEQAFEIVIRERGLILSKEDFINTFYEMRRVIYCVIHYYRDRVLRTILESGLSLDVFGDSWQNCPLRFYPNLICHPNVTVEESLLIYRQSKLSLNIMSWHKGGFTERMANIMLAGAVLVTDYTDYLNNRYSADDLSVFRLGKLEQLPQQIKSLLSNELLRRQIAENGKNKTANAHTWKKRAEQFLDILQRRI